MNKIIILIISLLLVFSALLFADRDHDEHHEDNENYENHDDDHDRSYKRKYKKSLSSKRVSNPLYQKECSACHFAYQPELLPKRSWEKIMANLDKHFDTDASLDKEEITKISNYLTANAGDNKNINYKHYRKIIRSISSTDTPIRISKTRYFKKEHRKIPKRFIEQEAVKSLSNCQKCHTSANRGYYGEKHINIPNYGKWDD